MLASRAGTAFVGVPAFRSAFTLNPSTIVTKNVYHRVKTTESRRSRVVSLGNLFRKNIRFGDKRSRDQRTRPISYLFVLLFSSRTNEIIRRRRRRRRAVPRNFRFGRPENRDGRERHKDVSVDEDKTK